MMNHKTVADYKAMIKHAAEIVDALHPVDSLRDIENAIIQAVLFQGFVILSPEERASELDKIKAQDAQLGLIKAMDDTDYWIKTANHWKQRALYMESLYAGSPTAVTSQVNQAINPAESD